LQQSGSADRYTLNFTLGDRHARSNCVPGRAEPFAPACCETSSVRRCDPRILAFARGVVTGFYGKLPARGDFVRAGLPRD
jgi:hypothetical protein